MSKAKKKISNINIENARIGFRNFAGAAGKFNAAGKRNFCVFLDPELGDTLTKDAWNVRWLQPKDDQEEPAPYLQVSVEFDHFPPKVVLITGQGKTTLGEDTISILDWAEISNVDLIIRPYEWEVNGKSGVKAYLKAMYITIVEDEFASKYYDVPDSASSAIVDND